MNTYKIFDLISITLFRVYLIVNFFNLFPLKLNSSDWLSDVTSLSIDTLSIVAIGFVFKFLSIKENYREKNHTAYLRSTFFVFILCLFIAISQILILPGSFDKLDFIYNQQIDRITINYENVEKNLNTEIEKTTNQINATTNNVDSEEIKVLKEKLDQLLLTKVESKETFNQIKESSIKNLNNQRKTSRVIESRDKIRTLILGLIWAWFFWNISKKNILNLDNL